MKTALLPLSLCFLLSESFIVRPGLLRSTGIFGVNPSDHSNDAKKGEFLLWGEVKY